MMIKGIFFDIDGTLLSNVDGSLPESTKIALTKLKNQGIKIFIASSRHWFQIQEDPINDIEFDGYVCLNGQLGLDSKKELLYSFPIHEEDRKELEEQFNAKFVPMVIVEEKRWYMNCTNEYIKASKKKYPPIDTYHGDDIYQVTAFVEDNKIKEVMKHLNHCKLKKWKSNRIDIISDTGGKAFGMEKMLRHHNLSRHEVMAFGDSDSDVDMLQFARVGVAMKDSTPEVLNIADFITDTAHNGGILKALQHYNIITD